MKRKIDWFKVGFIISFIVTGFMIIYRIIQDGFLFFILNY